MHVEVHDTMEELERAVRKAQVGRVRDRIHGVLLARRGYTAVEIAETLSVSRRAVQDWVRRYNQDGLARLPDAPRSGQPRKCPKELFKAVKQRILDGSGKHHAAAAAAVLAGTQLRGAYLALDAQSRPEQPAPTTTATMWSAPSPTSVHALIQNASNPSAEPNGSSARISWNPYETKRIAKMLTALASSLKTG